LVVVDANSRDSKVVAASVDAEKNHCDLTVLLIGLRENVPEIAAWTSAASTRTWTSAMSQT
jgi:hypothetical protein